MKVAQLLRQSKTGTFGGQIGAVPDEYASTNGVPVSIKLNRFGIGQSDRAGGRIEGAVEVTAAVSGPEMRTGDVGDFV